MAMDVLDASGQVVEGMAVGGEHTGHAVELTHLVERHEEVAERIGAGVDAGDVRRDRR